MAGRVEVRCADWVAAMREGTLPEAAAAFIDPARRVGARRVFHLDQVQPPLADIVALAAQLPVTGVKVMPGVNDGELPADCGVEFVSHEGVCKEAVLWFGPAIWHRRWATILGTETIQAPTDVVSPPLGAIAPGMVLYEPDPALIRAHALAWMCAQLGAHLFDDQIAYLVAPAWRPVSYAQSFTIDEVWPFSLKRLNGRLAALGAGTLELKKRGFPVPPESLRSQLRTTPGGRPLTVIFTRRGNERIMMIGRRLSIRMPDEGE
ncbi:MAG: hypothetical protein IPK16_27675 [Anaerolineales bacterium]|nr:hypothetical protein [Anaerolineales bacterium]